MKLPQSDGRGWSSSVFRLDYVSCFLTVLSTVLVGRKLWPGLVIAAVNSVLICVIGFHTGQFGLIPANLFCIAVYTFSIRSWARQPEPVPAPARLPPSASLPLPPRSQMMSQPPIRSIRSAARASGLRIVYRASADGKIQNSLTGAPNPSAYPSALPAKN